MMNQPIACLSPNCTRSFQLGGRCKTNLWTCLFMGNHPVKLMHDQPSLVWVISWGTLWKSDLTVSVTSLLVLSAL